MRQKAKHETQNADAVSTQLCQTHTRAHNLCLYVCIRTVYATSLAAMAFSLDSCTLPNSEYWHLIAMVPDRFAEDPDGFTDHVERHDALLCTTKQHKKTQAQPTLCSEQGAAGFAHMVCTRQRGTRTIGS